MPDAHYLRIIKVLFYLLCLRVLIYLRVIYYLQSKKWVVINKNKSKLSIDTVYTVQKNIISNYSVSLSLGNLISNMSTSTLILKVTPK